MKLMEKIKVSELHLIITGNCPDVVANSLLITGIDFIYVDEIKQDIDKIINTTANYNIVLCNSQIFSKIKRHMNHFYVRLNHFYVRFYMNIERKKSIKTYFLKNHYYYTHFPHLNDAVELETKEVFGKTILL